MLKESLIQRNYKKVIREFTGLKFGGDLESLKLSQKKKKVINSDLNI